MTDLGFLTATASTLVVGTSILSIAGLRAWRGWLELRRLELDSLSGRSSPGACGRPDITQLKERVRKLEAIASGVDF